MPDFNRLKPKPLSLKQNGYRLSLWKQWFSFRIPGVDLSDWCNWRGAVRHHTGDRCDRMPEDLVEAFCVIQIVCSICFQKYIANAMLQGLTPIPMIPMSSKFCEAECHMEIAALYHQGRITLRRDLGTSAFHAVLVATSMILRWWVERPSWEERGDVGRNFHCPLWDHRDQKLITDVQFFTFFFCFVLKLWKVESAVFHVVEAARQDLPEVGVFYNGNFRGIVPLGQSPWKI